MWQMAVNWVTNTVVTGAYFFNKGYIGPENTYYSVSPKWKPANFSGLHRIELESVVIIWWWVNSMLFWKILSIQFIWEYVEVELWALQETYFHWSGNERRTCYAESYF